MQRIQIGADVIGGCFSVEAAASGGVSTCVDTDTSGSVAGRMRWLAGVSASAPDSFDSVDPCCVAAAGLSSVCVVDVSSVA